MQFEKRKQEIMKIRQYRESKESMEKVCLER